MAYYTGLTVLPFWCSSLGYAPLYQDTQWGKRPEILVGPLSLDSMSNDFETGMSLDKGYSSRLNKTFGTARQFHGRFSLSQVHEHSAAILFLMRS